MTMTSIGLPVSPLVGRSAVVHGGWLVGAETTNAPFRLSDASSTAKLMLHAAPAGELAKRLNVVVGHVEFFDDGLVVAGLVPGKWLVLGSTDSADLAERLVSIATEESSTVVDVTDGQFLVRLTGLPAPLTLARLCAIDLGDRGFPNGFGDDDVGRRRAHNGPAGRPFRRRPGGAEHARRGRALLLPPVRGSVTGSLARGRHRCAGRPLGLEFEGGAAYRSGRIRVVTNRLYVNCRLS